MLHRPPSSASPGRRSAGGLSRTTLLALGLAGAAAVGCVSGRPPGTTSGTGERLPSCPEPPGVPFGRLRPDSQARLVVNATRTKRAIPGWNDEQRLAVRGTSGLRYGPLARIIPHDTLEQMTDATFEGVWVLVARIQARGPYEKLGLGATSYAPDGEDTSTNSVWICRQLSDGQWYARIIRPDNRVSYLRAIRDQHPGARVPGAARWVWREDDEGAWMMCGSGCCTLNALM